MLRKIVFLFLISIFGQVLSEKGEVIIKINQGELAGEWKESMFGKKFASFQGIPYAKPPVGDRRFKEPEPAKSWLGIWQAKEPSSQCLQWNDFGNPGYHVDGDEDCLYLNVFSPKPSSESHLPVVVYIHGGAFIFGSAIFYGPKFLMDVDVVLVTINYRLGPLGFLSTQDEVVPGNNGLKDQVMGLKWVKDNIDKFGGDPNSLTVMGMSAGGASVNYLMLSPLANGLIHKGISESGTICNPWTMQEKPLEKAVFIANHLGCPTTSTKDMIACLRKRPAASIVKTVPLFIPFLHAPFSPFAPVVEPSTTENAFIKKHPYKMMEDGEIKDIPWISSITAQEGLYPVSLYIKQQELLDEIESKWEELVPHMFDFNHTIPAESHAWVAEEIKKSYMKNKKLSIHTISQFIDAFSDRHFINGIEQCSKVFASTKKSPVYVYKFKYSGEHSLGTFLSNTVEKYGVSHGDDTTYILDLFFIKPWTKVQDVKMVKFLTNMVSSFAKKGVPDVGVEWTPLSGDGDMINYLEIDGPYDVKMNNVKTLKYNSVWDKFEFDENERANKKPAKTEL